MGVKGRFSASTEMAFGETSVTHNDNDRPEKKAKRQLPCASIEFTPPGYLCVKRDTKIPNHGDKYRWVSQVLTLEPHSKIKGAPELTLGRKMHMQHIIMRRFLYK